MLEEVFRVAPVPEDYMKYQLHLSTGMEVPQIEQWFQNRRSNDGGSQRPMDGAPFVMIPHRSLSLCRPLPPLNAQHAACASLRPPHKDSKSGVIPQRYAEDL